MTTAVVEFENGYPLTQGKDPAILVKEAIASNQATWYELNEGDHDVTPEWWTKNHHRHVVTVLEDGTALYRALPKDSEVGLLDRAAGKKTFTEKRGGTHVHIPNDQSFAIIAGPKKDLSGLGIHRVIFSVPGPNPSSRRQVAPWIK